MFDFLKAILEKIDNDTLIIFGLIGIAVMYSLVNGQESGQIVSNIVSGFIGYLGGQLVNTKKE